ncbi:hypothetical protein [Actinoplanes philippinensis]|uniref:hypothetical protein n=1 Tax=Actinoplanes philippinensis TaxID=35752 RepID=UPI0034119B77
MEIDHCNRSVDARRSDDVTTIPMSQRRKQARDHMKTDRDRIPDQGDRTREQQEQYERMLTGVMQSVMQVIDDFLGEPATRKPPVLHMITFADVVRYFTDKHPGDAGIAGGALLHQDHPRGHLFFQVFLDRDNRIHLDAKRRPVGRAFIARVLDDELAQKFEDVDLVIFR